MNETEIVEANILLANFMGWEYKEAAEYAVESKVYHTSKFHQRVYQEAEWFAGNDYVMVWVGVSEFLPKDLKFHKSYDWIMEVVEKIKIELAKTGDGVCIEMYEKHKGEYYTSVDFGYIVQIEHLNSLQAIYQACVEFVKWYNEPKV